MIQPGSVAFIDARSGRLVGDVPAGPGVGFVRSGLGSVWEMEDAGVLLQINQRTRHLTRSISVGVNAGDVAVGEGAVWITDKDSQTLLRVGPRYGDIAHIRLPASGLSRPSVGGGVAVGAGSVWVAQGLSRITRISPASGQVESSLPVADASVVAFGEGAVWVAGSDRGTLTKIDPRTSAIAWSTRIGPGICCVVAGGGYVWAANDAGISKLATDGRVLDTITTPSQTGNISFGDGALWVANDVAGTVMRIDPRTDATSKYRVGHLLTGISVEAHTIAVSVHPTGRDLFAHLSGPILQVRDQDWFNLTDPAVAAAPGSADQPWEQQLQYATCARLLTYPDAPAPDGWRLVPEIAAAWPSVSPDGHTYTFRITPGFRFSPPSGQMVTAATFKYTIERALSPALGSDPPALSVASDIAGLPAYRAGSSPHISGIRATKNTLAITLVRRAPDFPERIALSYFSRADRHPDSRERAPRPGSLGWPLLPERQHRRCRRGPQAQPELPRQPPPPARRHRLPRAATHRPGGGRHRSRTRRLRRRAGPRPRSAGRGRAPVQPPAAGRPRRYFVTPLLATDELAFDTRHGPFTDPRLRRAASYALDRPTLAAALGDLVTDRYLPPGMPALRDRHVSPLTGPDLRRARALAGPRTGRVVLAVCSDPGCLRLGQIIQADLEHIGLHIKLRPYAGAIASATSLPGADIVLARVFGPYPDPVAFLRTALGGRFAQDRLDKIARLDRRQRLAAAGQLELQLMRGQAPLAAFGTPAIPEFFSARVSCHIFQPLQFGADLGSLCLRSR